jgi:hypothetical protein
MVTLFFSQLTDSVGESEGLAKIFELKMPLEVMTVHDLPAVIQLPVQLRNFSLLQRRCAAPAGNALLLR